MPNTVAIYARISQDRSGEGQGVGRQLADCRAEAERRGWQVAEEYVDDDVSAYSGRARPAYRRLLNDLAERRRDGLIVWHLDRLHRRPIELEEFVRTCQHAGVSDVVTLHGDFNLGTGDGLLVARLLGAVAANESDSKRRRGRRKMRELAEAGRPNGGGPRPFGYEADKVTVREPEAAIIRQLAARALAGESLTSLCRWLVESEVQTVGGKTWRTVTVRQLLINPRIYGWRSHHGQPVAPAVWPAIITRDEGERLRLKLTDPARRTNRTASRYLLSGLCRCHACGSVMYSVPRYDTRRYLCRSGHDFGGCGTTTITAGPAERIIVEAVLQRLDSPALADALSGRARDTEAGSQLHQRIAEDTDQLAELAELYAARQVTAPEWIAARKSVEQRREQNRRALAQLAGSQAIDPHVGNGDRLRQEWSELNLSRQIAVVEAVIDHVVIGPGRRGVRSVEVERVRPVWRL